MKYPLSCVDQSTSFHSYDHWVLLSSAMLQIRPPLVPVTYGSSGAAVKRTGSGQAKQEHKKKRKRGGWSSSDDEVAADSDSEHMTTCLL